MPARYRDPLVALLVVAAIGAGTWLATGRSAPGPSSPLDYVPGDVAAVARLNVPAVTASPLVNALFPGDDQAARLERLCGFDPTEGLRDLIVFVTRKDSENLGHLGLVARGSIERERLAECVRKLVQEEGGSARLTEMDGRPALASESGASRAAFVGDDAVAVGSEGSVQGVLDAVKGSGPSASGHETLAPLWSRVAEGRDVAFVAALPKRWRRVVTGLMRRHLKVAIGRVDSLAIGADLERGLELGAVVVTGDAEEAARAVERVQQRIERIRVEPIVAFSVLGTVLRRVKLAAEGPEIVVTLRLGPEQVDELVAMLDDMRSARRRPASGTRADRPAPSPDTVIRRDGAPPGPPGSGGGQAP